MVNSAGISGPGRWMTTRLRSSPINATWARSSMGRLRSSSRCHTPAAHWNQLPMYQKPLSFVAGAHYKLTFWAKSTAPRWVAVWISRKLRHPAGAVILRMAALRNPLQRHRDRPPNKIRLRHRRPGRDVWFDAISLLDETTGVDLITNGDFNTEFFNDDAARELRRTPGRPADCKPKTPHPNLRACRARPELASRPASGACCWSMRPIPARPTG